MRWSNYLQLSSAAALLPLARASFALPLLLVVPACAEAQSATDIDLPADWTVTSRKAEAIEFTTNVGAGAAFFAVGDPEALIKESLQKIGGNGADVKSMTQGDAAIAIVQKGNAVAMALGQSSNGGKSAVIVHLLTNGPTSDDAAQKVRETLPVLAAMASGARMAARPSLSGNSDTASSPSPKAATGAPLSPLAKAPPGLVGYWRGDGIDNQYSYPGGMTMVAISDDYVFTPGGYFIEGAPEGTGFGDAGAIETMRRDPEYAGVFVVKPNVIELRYASGKTDKLDYRREGGDYVIEASRAGISYLGKKTVAPNGYRLNGVWHNQRITDTGAGFVSGSSYLHFTSAGQFLYSNSVAFSGANLSTMQRDPSAGGTYSIADGALTLRYLNGKTETLSIFWETSPDRAMWLNNAMYKPAG